MTNEKDNFKSGFVSIIGAPNVGKSTLLNRMLGEKIAITCRKPQTTRNRILGIVHRPSAQLVFMDTPGIHQARSELNIRIVEAAISSLSGVDVVLFVADVSKPDDRSETLVVEKLKKQKKPVICALNKTDLIKNHLIPSLREKWESAYPFKAVVPVSARHGDGIEELLSIMETALPFGPAYYPEDSLTDMPERFIAAEIVREKVFRFTGEEIPYSTAVTADSFSLDEKKKLLKIHATIHLERDSQKGIVIGKKGSRLEMIGKAARKDIERMTGVKVFLKLFVRVQKNWSKDTKALLRFGY